MIATTKEHYTVLHYTLVFFIVECLLFEKIVYVEFLWLIMLNTNLQSSIAVVLIINIIIVLLYAITYSCNAPWTGAQ